MFWFGRPWVAFMCHALLFSTVSCSDSEPMGDAHSAALSRPYFSLADYFNEEARRLQRNAPVVNKIVAKDGTNESRALQVDDWTDELALFIDSDINKPAWRASYRIDSLDNVVTYTSLDSTLRTRWISIETRANGSVKRIAAYNHVANMLYRADERLDYHVDSLYRIDKQQRVRIIGNSHYTVSGSFD